MVVIIVFSIFEIVVGLFFLFFIRDSPEKQFGISIETQKKEILMVPINEENRQTPEESTKTHKKGIPFMQALKIPNIINFALSFACLKCLAYALSMWLPFYLDSKIHKEQ